MPNCRLYVLDDRLSPLPAGVYGELYIGGACVGRGYRGAPELTKKAFLPDPFTSDGMMYRSGDVACWTRSGEVRLRGRTDRQIKLRGQRVEPDELRFCLESCQSVKKAAVRACEQFGQTVLCAYYTGDEDVPETELMLDALPSNASGKVDLPRLKAWEPAPAAPQATPDDEIAAPSKPAAAAEASPAGGADIENVRRIWMEELDRETVSDSESFFSQGGTSLAALGVLTKYYSAGISMTLAEFYANPTIAGQAELFRPHGKSGDRKPAESGRSGRDG